MGAPTNVSCNSGNNGGETITVSGGTNPYTYLWAPGGNSNSNITGLTAGNYTLTVTDNNGCTTKDSVVITQPTPLSVIASVSANVSCNGGNNGSASATAGGGTPAYTYNWAPSGGTNSTANGLNAGTYTITVTDNSQCTKTTQVSITEPTPIVVTSQNQTICQGQTTSLNANATGGTGPYLYLWMPGGGTGQSITVSPASLTVYTITVTDGNGCTSTITATVYITQSSPLLVSGAQSICGGNSVTLTATGSGGTYAWQPGNITGSIITVTPSVTTTYTVTDSTLCGAQTNTVTITVSPIPSVAFNSDIRDGCSPLCIQFRDLSSGIITQWNWKFGDGDSSNLENPIYCYPNPGNYTVNLTVTTGIGCSSTLKILDMITVYSHPVAAFSLSPEPATILDPTIQYTDLSTDKYGISYWWWTFGDSEDSLSTIRDPSHTYRDTGEYCARLVVMDIHGCLDTTIKCFPIEPVPTLYIPSAFSPNGDGLNDVFTAKGDYIKTFEMYIYDRWGMKLFHSNSIEKGWDGTLDGVACQEDTYVYLINVTDVMDNRHKYLGNVTLIR